MTEPTTIIDSHGGLRRTYRKVADNMRVRENHILWTPNRELFESGEAFATCRAAVLIRPDAEITRLTNIFRPAIHNPKLCKDATMTAEVGPGGTVLWSLVNDAAQELIQGDIKTEMDKMVRLHEHFEGPGPVRVELMANFTEGLHKHKYRVLNCVLGDTGTGWYTENGPDNAGEGNLFFFGKNFPHEATSRNPQPHDRLTLIVYRPQSLEHLTPAHP